MLRKRHNLGFDYRILATIWTYKRRKLDAAHFALVGGTHLCPKPMVSVAVIEEVSGEALLKILSHNDPDTLITIDKNPSPRERGLGFNLRCNHPERMAEGIRTFERESPVLPRRLSCSPSRRSSHSLQPGRSRESR